MNQGNGSGAMSDLRRANATGTAMTDATAYNELRAAVDRFLAGSYNVAYLLGWCSAHFKPPEEAVDDDPAIQLWNFLLLNLNVYCRCDLERWTLDESLRVLLQSFEEEGYGCLTPITTSRCFVEMVEADYRSIRNGSF
jgi:hypothetical protein